LPQIQQLELQKMNKAAAAKCVEDLKDIYQKYLLSFALQNQGKYPSKEAVANVIDSKKYCYIANRKNSEDKNMPLLFDCSNNHGNQINVLFVDGTVRSFEIENVNAPKKVISYLHSVYRYKAQTFAELLKLVK
jgi:prepilin-type processing-associated H-X9-DG protein